MLVTCHKCFCFYCFDPDILGKYSCDKCDKLLYWIFVGDCRSKSVVGWGDGGEWKSKHNMLITLFIKRPTHQFPIIGKRIIKWCQSCSNASALTGGGKGGYLVCLVHTVNFTASIHCFRPSPWLWHRSRHGAAYKHGEAKNESLSDGLASVDTSICVN